MKIEPKNLLKDKKVGIRVTGKTNSCAPLNEIRDFERENSRPKKGNLSKTISQHQIILLNQQPTYRKIENKESASNSNIG